MAKIKIPSKRSKRWKGYKAMTGPKTIKSKIELYRSSQAGASGEFMACARAGTGPRSRRSGAAPRRNEPWQVCASGRNPRLAIGRALAKLGRKLAHRKGAFAGR